MGMLLSFEVTCSTFRIPFLISNLNLPCCSLSHFSPVDKEQILPFIFVFGLGLVGHVFYILKIFLTFFQTLLQINHILNYSIKTSFTTPIASYKLPLQENNYFTSCIYVQWHSLFCNSTVLITLSFELMISFVNVKFIPAESSYNIAVYCLPCVNELVFQYYFHAGDVIHFVISIHNASSS